MTKTLREVSWDWPEITCMLMWKLAPKGCTITRQNLGALPRDRVLVEDRTSEGIDFQWISLEEAQKRSAPVAGVASTTVPRASVSQLSGRWQKIAVVLMWKLARDGVRLTLDDKRALPSDQTLLAEGHANDIEYRFVPRADAVRIAVWERDNEGKMVLEVVR